jgi:hyperosmotically inducible periplasmic protein
MSIIRTFVLAVAAVLGAALLAACAQTDQRRATGQVIDDASVTARVKTALAREEGLASARDINVTTYQGTVQLSGFVDSGQTAARASDVARNVPGVQSVRNDLRVTAQGARPDASAGSGATGSGTDARGTRQSGY